MHARTWQKDLAKYEEDATTVAARSGGNMTPGMTKILHRGYVEFAACLGAMTVCIKEVKESFRINVNQMKKQKSRTKNQFGKSISNLF